MSVNCKMGVEGGNTFFSLIYLSLCDTVPGIMAKNKCCLILYYLILILIKYNMLSLY